MNTLDSRLGRHVARWEGCTRCAIGLTAQHHVFARGELPCDVLLIGEAPGRSEDIIGQPFVGPAGQLLDKLLADAAKHHPPLRICITNIVSCIPLAGPDRRDTRPPTKEEITNCRYRLLDFLEIAQPPIVIFLGTLAHRTTRDYLPDDIPHEHFRHPSAILRQNSPRLQQQWSLAFAKFINTHHHLQETRR